MGLGSRTHPHYVPYYLVLVDAAHNGQLAADANAAHSSLLADARLFWGVLFPELDHDMRAPHPAKMLRPNSPLALATSVCALSLFWGYWGLAPPPQSPVSTDYLRIKMRGSMAGLHDAGHRTSYARCMFSAGLELI